MSEKLESQSCPRRMTERGPWKYEENLDLWVSNRWSTDRVAVTKSHDAEDERGLSEHNERNAARGEPPITIDEYRTKWHVRGATNDLWLWPGDSPRTCNFCGGVHPEDAIRLLSEGWEVEGTTKGYKRYLHPPGFRQRSATLLKSFAKGTPFKDVPEMWSPTPPVKLYVQHFVDEQINRFNEALLPKPT